MSATAIKERQIKGDRKPRTNLCGDCGNVIDRTDLLCEDCRVSILVEDADGWDG